MNVKTIFLLSLVGYIAFNSTDAFAQKSYRDVTDSLLAQGVIKKTVRSFYIKPVFEQYQSLVSVEGDGFTRPTGDLVRKRGFGVRIGYQWKAFEVETGISNIRPAAGYRYMLGGSTGHTTRVRSTDFYHVPVGFRFRFWQPTKKLSFRVGAGAAYNMDLDKLKLAPEDNLEEGTLDANGNKVILARTKSWYEQRKSFFSAELNLSTQYRFSSHFSANIEVRRLFSSMDVVRLKSTQQTFNPPVFRNVEARGGANSLSINIGLSYQFGSNNRYNIK